MADHADHPEQEVTMCAECGAPSVDGMGCWEQLGAVIAWEYQDAELLGEHFLTVASYNLQHPAQFTEAALDELRVGFMARLDEGIPVEQVREQMSRSFEGSKRVLRKEAERRPVLRQWSMTIADVYLPDQPEGAAARVRQWAAAIRREL